MTPKPSAWLCALILSSCAIQCIADVEIEWYVTTRNGSKQLFQMPSATFSSTASVVSDNEMIIVVDSSITYQTMSGIGSSLEGSTCFNLMQLNESMRNSTLESLFDPINGIGMNLMRLTIGTSDFNPLPFYSYDDTSNNNPDNTLSSFSISADETFVLPAIKSSLVYTSNKQDGLSFFASPWSPPAWMKTSQSLQGGAFNSSYIDVYGEYLVKFVEAYHDQGIDIEAITPQNEPLQNEDSYPTTLLLPEQESQLVQQSLGPRLEASGLNCEIWCFDHNWADHYYPEHILNNSEAAAYVAGTAFHLYEGFPKAMTDLHDKYPDKDVHFSEGSEFKLRGAHQMVNIFRNWASTYNAWVTMLDTNLQPNAGPFHPTSTMLELDADSGEVIKRFEYYMTGQFSKFIRKGALRVESSTIETTFSVNSGDDDMDPKDQQSVVHVAFMNADSDTIQGNNQKTIVLVVVNVSPNEQPLSIQWNGIQSQDIILDPESVSTFRWGY
jgi:O-glycosyl hydrolase